MWGSWDCFCYGILLHLDNPTFGNFPALCVGLAYIPSKSCWFFYLTQIFTWSKQYLCHIDHAIFLWYCFELVAVIMKLWLAAGSTICREVKKILNWHHCPKIGKPFFCHCAKVDKCFLVTGQKLGNLFWVKIELWLD